jgi:hypothetical protein
MAFQRSSGAECDDRQPMRRTGAQREGDFVGGFGKGNGIRRLLR